MSGPTPTCANDIAPEQPPLQHRQGSVYPCLEGRIHAYSPRCARLEGDGGWKKSLSKVQAPSAYQGASDFIVGALQFQRHTGQAILKLFRGNEKEKPELHQRVSPIFHISEDAPPLVIH